MQTGTLGRILFEIGYYRNEVVGRARLGVTKNLFGRTVGVWGGGLSVANEKAVLKTMLDPALGIADKREYLVDIREGRAEFIHVDLVKDVKPVLTKLLEIPELKEDAHKALDKLFPPPVPGPAADQFASPSMVALAGEVGQGVLTGQITGSGEAPPSKSDVNAAYRQDQVNHFKASESDALKAIQGSDLDVARLAFEGLLLRNEYNSPLELMKAAASWNVPKGDLEVLAGQLLDKLPIRLISSGKNGRVENFLGDTDIAGVVHIGGRKEQQDGMAILKHAGKTYLLVADGMGGHSDGEKASATALEKMIETIINGGDIKNAIQWASAAVDALGTGKSGKGKMGTTIIAAEFDEIDNKVNVASIGDSPVYLVKENGEVQLLALPHIAFLDVLVRQPNNVADNIKVKTEELRVLLGKNPDPPYPARASELLAEIEKEIKSVYGNNGPMTESLVAVSYALGHGLPADIQVGSFTLQGGDRLLLTSDGMDRLPQEISAIMSQNKPMAQKLDELVAATLAAHQRGDNITVVGLEAVEVVTSSKVFDSRNLPEAAAAPAPAAEAEDPEAVRVTQVYNAAAQQPITDEELGLRAQVDQLTKQVATLQAEGARMEGQLITLMATKDTFEHVREAAKLVADKFNELRRELSRIGGEKRKVNGDKEFFARKLEDANREVADQHERSEQTLNRAKEAAEATFKQATNTTRIIALRTEIEHLKSSPENRARLEFSMKMLDNLESAARNNMERKLARIAEEEAARQADEEAQVRGNKELAKEITGLETELSILSDQEARTAERLTKANSEVEAYRKFFAGMVDYLDNSTKS